MPPSCSPFASVSVRRHLARGGTGFLALAASPFLLHAEGLPGLLGGGLAIGLAAILLRGCPMCWVIGLAETVALRAPRNVPASSPRAKENIRELR